MIMNKYRVTDMNNVSYLIQSHSITIETINNTETYIAFYVDDEIIAVLNLSNITAVIKEID